MTATASNTPSQPEQASKQKRREKKHTHGFKQLHHPTALLLLNIIQDNPFPAAREHSCASTPPKKRKQKSD